MADKTWREHLDEALAKRGRIWGSQNAKQLETLHIVPFSQWYRARPSLGLVASIEGNFHISGQITYIRPPT